MTGSAAAPGLTWGGVTFWPPRAAIGSIWGRRLARDVMLLQASNTLQKGYGAVFNVACFRLLGAAGYGEFLLVLSLYNTINLLGTLGLGQFLVVPLSQAAAAGDKEEVTRACGYNVKFSIVIALIAITLAFTIGPWFGVMVYGPEHGARLGGLMRIVALGAIPLVGYTLTTSSLQAIRRMKELAIVENVDGFLFRAIGVAALIAGMGVEGLLWGVAIGGTISAAHALYRYQRIAVCEHDFPGYGRLLSAAWSVPIRHYLRFSALAVADKNVSQFFSQTPLLFLGRWAGPEQAAYFGVAAKLFALLSAFHGAASRALSVRLSQEYGAHGAAPTRRLFWRSLLVWGGISSLGAAAFCLLLPVFRWIYTPEAFPSLALVIIFAILTAKQGFTVTLGAIYLILDRVAVNVLVKIPLLLIAMPAGALLVQRWGAAGAAAYQLGAYVLGDVIYFSLLAGPWLWRERRQKQES